MPCREGYDDLLLGDCGRLEPCVAEVRKQQQVGLEVVPLPGVERHTRAFALHDQPDRDTLDTARGRGLTAGDGTLSANNRGAAPS